MESENPEDATMVAGLLPLASVSQQPYVSELLSFTLDRLHKEPELLRVDAERIRRQMQEVAVGNYRAFVAAADALLSIREEVTADDKHLESLVIDQYLDGPLDTYSTTRCNPRVTWVVDLITSNGH